MRQSMVIFAAILLMSGVAVANPLNDSITSLRSTAHFYDASSVFTHPAALGFQTELNGSTVSSSLAGSFGAAPGDFFSAAFAWRNFGFGIERLVEGADETNRYNLALGIPLHSALYFGARVAFIRGSATIGEYTSWDIGFQIRPNPRIAFSLLANHINNPTSASGLIPLQWVAGILIRPFKRIELSADFDTPQNQLGKIWGYQATLGLDVMAGMQLRAGYHDTYGIQVGLRMDFGATSVGLVGQPSHSARTLTVSLDSTLIPRRTSFSPPKALHVVIDDTLQEEPREGNLFLPDRPSLWQKLELLKRAENDPHVEVVAIEIEGFPLGLAAAMELSEQISRLKKKGTVVEAYLGNSDLKEFIIAAPANRIFMAEGSQLSLTGLKASHLFITGTLEKIGIEGEMFARGKYKSAPETFTKKESSKEAREMYLDLLQTNTRLIKTWLNQTGRVPEKNWDEIFKGALFSANEAKKAGLIDTIGLYSTQKKRLDYANLLLERLDLYRDSLTLPRKVAVIHAGGAIVQSAPGFPALGGDSVMVPEAMEKKFKAALDDPRTDAIVMRISSGGGEVGASYAIASLVEQARFRKPVIVSMGDMAASGGYLIAAPAERIFSHPATLTGSIGVFTGKANLAGIMKKIDLRQEILSLAPHADLMSWDRPFSPEGRKIMVRELNDYYDGFTSYVSKNRKLSAEKVEDSAQGRVWAGSDAVKRGLSDDAGGFLTAVNYAVERGTIDGDAVVWEVGHRLAFLQFMDGKGFLGETALSALSPEVTRSLFWMASLQKHPFLFLSPVVIQ